MKSDSLQQYVPRLESILNEKAELEKRLGEIDQILQSLQSKEFSSSPPSSGGGAKKARAAKKVPKAGARTRAQNKMSLREAVRQATASKPLTKAEILEAIVKLGYKFSTSNPLNSLSSALYGDKKEFRNVGGGRFSPIKGAGSSSSSPSSSGGGAKKARAAKKVPKAGARTRAQNKMSLREAVRQATASKPMTKAEILEAIDKLGYKFNTSKPANSLNSVLYGDNKEFQSVGGRFGPIKGAGSSLSSPLSASRGEGKEIRASVMVSKAGARTRAQNKMSLREAVRQATAGKPMTKAEILEAIDKLGYKFNTSDPVNSLNCVLYDTKKKLFKNFNGRFGLA